MTSPVGLPHRASAGTSSVAPDTASFDSAWMTTSVSVASRRRNAATLDGDESSATTVPDDSAGCEVRTRIRSRYVVRSDDPSLRSDSTLAVTALSPNCSHGVPLVKPKPGADAVHGYGVLIRSSGLVPVIPSSSP